jgi:hypothetical protein
MHEVVDAQKDPELKYALLNGQLNAFVCPTCGLAGQMASPILFHDAEHEMFLVYMPMELNLPHVEQEQLIGRLVKQVMDSTPAEQRRAYMLQPQTIINYQTFLEKVLETEGVTPDMIARQRQQAELLDTLATADAEVRDILLAERADEIDETFFALLQNAMQVAEQRQDNQRMLKLTNLQARLYTDTEVGRRMERQQIALRRLEQDVRRANGLTPQILLKHILANEEDEQIIDMIATSAQSALNYEFFQLLTQELESAARQKDKPRVNRLRAIRRRLLDIQQAMEQASQEMIREADSTLNLLRQADDPRQAIQENVSKIDEPFMYMLSARIAEAEQRQDAAEIVELRKIYELIVEEAERQAPPYVRLVNQLVRAGSDEERRRLLDENPELVTPELAEMLGAVIQEMGADSRPELAQTMRSLQAMVEMRTSRAR